MGQGYSSILKDGDTLFDQGKLEEAENKYASLDSLSVPHPGSDETLLEYATCKLQASMNLNILTFIKNQYNQAEKQLEAALEIEVKHSDSQKQHHVNTLAIFYWVVMNSINLPEDSDQRFQRITSLPFVAKALEARPEHSLLIYCAHSWLLFRIGHKSLNNINSYLKKAEQLTSRLTFATETIIKPTINFEVDAELEVDLGQDDDIGDVPSDDEGDDADGLVGSHRSEDSGSPSNIATSPSPSTETNPEAGSNNHNHFGTISSGKPNPLVELLKSIILTADKSIETIQVQALAQASKALAVEFKANYETGFHPLYIIWKNRGRTAARLQNFRAALVAYSIALAVNWTNSEAWIDVASSFTSLGDFDTSREYLTLLTDVISPNGSMAWMERGLVCMKSYRFAEAAMCFDRILLGIEPSSIAAMERRAFATLKLRNWSNKAITDAIGMCEKALSQDPHYAMAHLTHGQALVEFGLYSDAIHAFDQVLVLEPHNVDAIVGKATAFRNLRQYSNALTLYREAYQLRPSSADIVFHNALTHLEMCTSYSNAPEHELAHPDPHQTVNGSPTTSSPNEPSGSTSGITNDVPQSSSNAISTSLSSSSETTAAANPQPNGAAVSNGDLALANGRFVGTLSFNQSHHEGYPTLLSVMHHLHIIPKQTSVEKGLEATENALEIFNKHPLVEPSDHHFYYPSCLPRSTSFYNDDPETNKDVQHNFLLSQIWATRALLLAHASRSSEALNAASRAVDVSPQFPSLALVTKGDVMTLVGKPVEEVHATYLQSLQADPRCEFAHLSLIHLLLAQNEGREALKYTSSLMNLAQEGYLMNPNLAVEIHASTLFHLRQYEAAYSVCVNNLPKSVDDSDSSADAETEQEVYAVRLLNIAAHSLHSLGKCDEGQHFFDRALRAEPLNVYTWNEKARCLLQNKRFDDALNYYDRALVLDTHNLTTICNRALCICLLGNIEEGSELLFQAETDHPGQFLEWIQGLSPIERAFHFDNMTVAREQRKRKDREVAHEESTGSNVI